MAPKASPAFFTTPDHKIEMVDKFDIRDLDVDYSYQRQFDPNRVAKIAATWLDAAARNIAVSIRDDGSKVCLDGNHRVQSAKQRGITHLRAEVHYGLSLIDEARLFLIFNKEGTPPNALDNYRAALTAEHPTYLEIEDILREWDFAIIDPRPGQDMTLKAVAGIVRTAEKHGPAALEAAIGFIDETWGRTREAYDGVIIEGVGRVAQKHPEILKPSLAAKLRKKYDPSGFMGTVHTISTVSATGVMHHSGTGGRAGAAERLIYSVHDSGKAASAKILKPVTP